MNAFQIAIDGPVAAGKTTTAKMVAKKLGFTYIDTGAMYRAVALAANEHKVEWIDESAISALVTRISISEYMRGKIRTQEIAEGASIVSQYPEVREKLVAEQRVMADDHDAVMEGRDIGTRVLPQAQLKIFLTADVETRVQREIDYLHAIHQQNDYESVREALLKRDEREINRTIDPLKPAPDAWILDSTNLSIEEVVVLIVTLAKLRRKA